MNQIKPDNKKKRVIAFIVARLNSSRLPSKQFRLIGDKSVLERIVNSLRQCAELDEIVITTVATPDNLPLKSFADEHCLPCFWYNGGVNDVTSRLVSAAEKFKAEICILVSGDCP